MQRTLSDSTFNPGKFSIIINLWMLARMVLVAIFLCYLLTDLGMGQLIAAFPVQPGAFLESRLMLRKGSQSVLLGLIAGMLIGFGILILKQYLAGLLLGVLEDEVKASCHCTLQYDSADMSFLPLRGEARNVRMLENGVTKVKVASVQGRFSLRDIRKHEVIITELSLNDGNIIGVGPQSPLYKLVDRIASPLPPGKNYPGRWKLVLMRLVLNEAKTKETLGNTVLLGNHASLTLNRTPENQFDLKAKIDNLLLLSSEKKELTKLGKISADLYLHDDYVQARALDLTVDKSTLSIEAITKLKEANKLSGIARYFIDSSSFPPSDKVSFTTSGEASLSGVFEEPDISFSLNNASPKPAISTPLMDRLKLNLDQLLSHGKASIREEGSSLLVNDLNASGERLRISLSTPITIKNGNIQGGLRAELRELPLDSLLLRNLATTIDVSGPLSDLKANAKGVFSFTTKGLLTLDDIDFNLSQTTTGLSFLVGKNIHSKSESFFTQGELAFPPDQAIVLEHGVFEAKDLALRPKKGSDSFLLLNTKGELSGPLAVETLNGTANFSLSLPTTPAHSIDGQAVIKDGVATVAAKDNASTIKAELKVPLKEDTNATLIVQAEDFLPLAAWKNANYSEARCLETSLSGSYSFQLNAPAEGNGQIAISEFTLGCSPDQLSLEKATQLSIEQGVLKIPDTGVSSPYGRLGLSGEASLEKGLALKAGGEIPLNSFLPFMPMVDELMGTAAFYVSAVGPISNLSFGGSIDLKDAGFDVNSLDASVTKLSGKATLKGRELQLEKISGEYNQGPFSLAGSIFPFDIAKSSLALKGQGFAIQPISNAMVYLSPNVSLSTSSSGRLLVSGAVSIDSATIERNIRWTELLTALPKKLLTRRAIEAQSSPSASTLPVDLKLSLVAPDGIVLLSNLFSVELGSSLNISGTLAAPSINGQLDIVSGRFGLQNRSFEITSGRVFFLPESQEPQLDILAETYARSRLGENTLVLVTITGPVSNPKVEFSSDLGLSQREILNLIMLPSDLTAPSRVSTISEDVEIDTFGFVAEDSMFGLGHWVRYLTRIDNLSVQPYFNPQRGVVEPSLVATKQLLEKVSLIAETSFATSTPDSRFELRYDLSSRYKLSGIAESLSSQRNTSLGLDLTAIVFADRPPSLELEIDGNRVLRNEQIKKALRLNEYAVVRLVEISSLAEKLYALYRTIGYFNPTISVSCQAIQPGSEDLCKVLKIDIHEGELTRLTAIDFTKDTLPEDLKNYAIIKDSLLGSIASEANLEAYRSLLTMRLRAEGYISARVQVSIDTVPGSSTGAAKVNLSLGRPVSFVFSGNTLFSPDDFLATIDIFERKLPFGSNTINILLQRMKDLYNRAGFLFVTLSHERTEDPQTRRIVYRISIDEGEMIKAIKVEFAGIGSIDQKRLEALTSAKSQTIYQHIFHPAAAVSSEIESNKALIADILAEDGIVNAKVESLFHYEPSLGQVTITYQGTGGTEETVLEATLQGFPEIMPIPEIPAPPLSSLKLTRYTSTLRQSLIDYGYPLAEVTVVIDPSSPIAQIVATPGEPRIISEILITGNKQISEATIRENLKLSTGEMWNMEQIAASKRRLLHLGLFSDVIIIPAEQTKNGTQTNSGPTPLEVRVTERTLYSMQTGAGINSENGFHLFGQYTDRSFFADGRSISARLDAYIDQANHNINKGIAGVTYADPSAFDDYGYVNDIRFQRFTQDTLPFDMDRTSIANYLHRNWSENTSLSFGHSLFLENLSQTPLDVILSPLDTGTNYLSLLGASVRHDTRDDPLLPRHGYDAGLAFALSSKTIASDANFFILDGNGSAVYPLEAVSDRLLIAFNMRAASGWTFGNTSEIPISQRFFSGGRASVRGFRENALGPRGAEGHVIGGDIVATQNFELRYLLAENVAGLVFIDHGLVALRNLDYPREDWRTSSGFGVHYLSPIGPIGIDIGFPLDEKPGEPSARIHFVIGSAF